MFYSCDQCSRILSCFLNFVDFKHLSVHLLCFPVESLCLLIVFNISGVQWVTVALALLGKGGIASSYIIIYIWTAELFPTSIRNVGIGASSLFLSIGGMIAPYTAHLVSMSNHSNYSIISKDRGSATILKTLLQLLLIVDFYIILFNLISVGRKRFESQFYFTYRYIDDVLSINNPDLETNLGQMYTPEHEIRQDGEQQFCFLLGFTPINR